MSQFKTEKVNVLEAFPEYGWEVWKYYLPSMPWFAAGMTICAFVSILIKKYKDFYSLWFFWAYATFIILIFVQQSLPIHRFTLYLAVTGIFGLAVMLENVGKIRSNNKVMVILSIAGVLFLILQLSSTQYNTQPDTTVYNTYYAIKATDFSNVSKIFNGITHAGKEIYFFEDIDYEEVMKEPDYAIVLKDMMKEGYRYEWPARYDYDEVPWEWINENMEVEYEDDVVISYKRKDLQ